MWQPRGFPRCDSCISLACLAEHRDQLPEPVRREHRDPLLLVPAPGHHAPNLPGLPADPVSPLRGEPIHGRLAAAAWAAASRYAAAAFVEPDRREPRARPPNRSPGPPTCATLTIPPHLRPSP